ncbi:SRPBCC family protein [Aquabacterium sp.]|jgi:uncharacterized protein YndB with AHSA1/START domain|uniref:SRPBCC family protein n=1 Tax=Aquabacterium sp. TaxID=1872578 RepID=UPI0025C52CF4|nr:SRPBCC family protein [Aquabacterium sp.]
MPLTAPTSADTDLRFERVVDLPPEAIWAAWTTPELVNQWFTPAPWRTSDTTIDLRPGGGFHTVMHGPEGERHAQAGCYLVVEPGRTLVWTSALLPGFQPAPPTPEGFAITATIRLTPEGQGTRYEATASHADAASRARHEAMGFEAGWGAALDQLVALMKAQARPHG